LVQSEATDKNTESKNSGYSLIIDNSSISFLRSELPRKAENDENPTNDESLKNEKVKTFLDLLKQHVLGKAIDKLELPQIIVTEATGADANGAPVDIVTNQHKSIKPVLRFLDDAFNKKDSLIEIIPHPDDKEILDSRRRSAELMLEIKKLRAANDENEKSPEEKALLKEFKQEKKKSKDVGEKRIQELIERDDKNYIIISDDALTHRESKEIGNSGQREHAAIVMNFSNFLMELEKSGVLKSEGIDEDPKEIIEKVVPEMNRRFSANNEMQTKPFEQAYPSRLKGSFAEMIKESRNNDLENGGKGNAL